MLFQNRFVIISTATAKTSVEIQEAIDLRHKSARNLNKSENQWLCFYVQVKMLNVLFQSLYFIECIYEHTHGNVTMSWFHSLLF